MSDKIAKNIAIVMLLLMFVLGVSSMRDDTAIMDEVAHLPAGYSYLTQLDYRLNPEHPPLIKDLAALPLLFMKINFPSQIKSWATGINDQWDFGFNFMYNADNNADQMLFWGRLPILLLSLLLGFLIFNWGRKLYDNNAGLLALFFYSLSPNILAHSRFVTTDIAAAFGFFIAIYSFCRWLKEQNNKNLVISGLCLGVALLLKFSTFLLLPLFVFLAIVWAAVNRYTLETFYKFRNKLLILFVIGFIVIYPVYQYHVWNYPPEMQQRDIRAILPNDKLPQLKNFLLWTTDKPILRAYGQYLFGLTMVLQRATGGNTTYFLGDVSNQGWKNYFPVVYAIKEPLAMHIFTLMALIYLAHLLSKSFYGPRSIRGGLKDYFSEFAMLSFISLYWFSSIMSNLNIGVRHVIPTFPFIYLLVSGQVTRVIANLRRPTEVKQSLSDRLPRSFYSLAMTVVVFTLLLWHLFASISIYPSYLAYFNELVGGAKNGYLYVTDSNLDWGQDLKRLVKWMDDHHIDKMKLDYFGGAAAQYYLGDRFIPLHRTDGPQKGLLAVSATFYQTSKINTDQSFAWLDAYEPIAKIGYSIFVYDIK